MLSQNTDMTFSFCISRTFKSFEPCHEKTFLIPYVNNKGADRGRTGLVVRASDYGSVDPGSILGQVGVLFP